MSRTAFNADHGWFQQLFALSPDPTWIIDGGRFVECNEAAVRALGYTSRGELLRLHPSKLSPARQPDGEDSYVKAERMMAFALEHGLHRFEWTHTKASGENFIAEVTLSAITLQDRRVLYCVWRDITERKQMEEQIRQLAFYDPLTSLPNRRLLNDRLSQCLAASMRSGCHGALMFLDLDGFKPLNDGHGHAVGDLLLIATAARLKSCMREMDTVARFGGDEFVVMVAELDTDKPRSIRQAVAIAEKLRGALAAPYVLQVPADGVAEAKTVEYQCTVSIGVVLFGRDGPSQDDLLRWADMAMYQAKEAGRNMIRFYDMEDNVII